MRLIDADALEEELKKDIMGDLNYSWYINNAPTVDVLEQIRAEIEQKKIYPVRSDAQNYRNCAFAEILEIIDKYR